METTVWEGRFIKVTTETILGDVWERAYLPHGVIIYPVTDEGKILFIREKRPHETPNVRIKPVTGMREFHLSPAENAQKEMREEIGFKAQVLEEFWTYQVSGTTNATTHYFLAKGLTPDPLPNPDGDIIEAILPLTPEEVDAKIASEEIRWGGGVMGWLRLKMLIAAGKASL